jgi:hypothetical protein
MADYIQLTELVWQVPGGTTTQPLEQALEVSGYAQLELVVGVHRVDGGDPGPTVSVLTGMDRTTESGWVVAGSFPEGVQDSYYKRSVRGLLRLARLQVSTGGYGAVISVRGLARTRAVPFQPTELADLVGWWHAEQGVTLDASTGGVSAWADQSGQGNHLVQATGAVQPTLQTSSPIADKTAIKLSGSQSMGTAAFGLGAFTFVTLVRATGTGGMVYETSTNIVSNDGNDLWGSTGATMGVKRGGVVSAKDLSTNWINDATPHAVAQRYDGTHAGHQLWIDGKQQTMANFGTPNDPGTATTTQPLFLGSRNNTTGFLAGYVRQVVLYNRALTDDELVEVSAYLRADAGLG